MSDDGITDEDIEVFQRIFEHYGTDDKAGEIAKVVLESAGAEVPDSHEPKSGSDLDEGERRRRREQAERLKEEDVWPDSGEQ